MAKCKHFCTSYNAQGFVIYVLEAWKKIKDIKGIEIQFMKSYDWFCIPLKRYSGKKKLRDQSLNSRLIDSVDEKL